jgi:hypothetical protein
MILIENVCQQRMHLQQRIVCQGQKVRNMIRAESRMRMCEEQRRTTRMLAIAGEVQHTSEVETRQQP